MKAKASRRIQELHDQLVQRDGEIAELRLQLDGVEHMLQTARELVSELERQLAHATAHELVITNWRTGEGRIKEVSPGEDAA